MTKAAISTRPCQVALSTITPGMGAEVSGVDLAQVSDETLRDIQVALDRHKVLVFRDQDLTRDSHKGLARRFGGGELHSHPLAIAKGMEDAEIAVIHTDERSKYTGGDIWHSDTTAYIAPVAYSLLYLTEMPVDGGGDTVFADMNRAWRTLSEPMQAFFADKRSVHDAGMTWGGVYGHKSEEVGAFPRTSHPVRLTHPRTGQPLLFVNRGFTTHIEGISKVEGRYLLDFLFYHIETTMTAHCRITWRPKTLVVWDNLATQHHAVWDYFPHRRHAERVSVIGERLVDSIAL